MPCQIVTTSITERELIRWRNTVDLSRVRALITEHKREVGIKGILLRMEYLIDELDDLKFEIFMRERRYERIQDNSHYINRAFLAKCIKDREIKANKIRSEISRLSEQGLEMCGMKPRTSRITDDMIERARAYPIENLIDARCGMALCIFHEDRRPSMYVKNNFVHCFSCGKTADTIDVYRKLHGTTFPEAVKALQ